MLNYCFIPLESLVCWLEVYMYEYITIYWFKGAKLATEEWKQINVIKVVIYLLALPNIQFLEWSDHLQLDSAIYISGPSLRNVYTMVWTISASQNPKYPVLTCSHPPWYKTPAGASNQFVNMKNREHKSYCCCDCQPRKGSVSPVDKRMDTDLFHLMVDNWIRCN